MVGDKRDKIVDLLAFVLMPNHYHFIIREVIDGGISLFMNKILAGILNILINNMDVLVHFFKAGININALKMTFSW